MLHIIIYEGVSLDYKVHHIPLPSHLHPFQTCDHMCINILGDDVGRKILWNKSYDFQSRYCCSAYCYVVPMVT